MDIYFDTLEEIKTLVETEQLYHLGDVTIFLDRCSDLDLLATGVYAEVYNLPGEPDKVVKVCTDSKDGYHVFARWCMRPENQDNPHLPNIHREDAIELGSGKVVRFYVLERLDHMTDDGKEATRPHHFHDIDFGLLWGSLRTITLSFFTNEKTFSHEFETLDDFIEQIKKSKIHMLSSSEHLTPPRVDDDIIDDHEGFIETLFEALTHIAPVGMIDLNGSNYMLRDDTVVITDPIAQKHPD